MVSNVWGPEIAEVFDDVYLETFEPGVLDPMADVLAELAGGAAALEFAVGTGRVALPLRARGVPVHGIELSPHMVARLRTKAADLPVTLGDMTTTRVPGTFAVVYLVANTIMNVTTQDEQVAVFANAAAHLGPGGCFVIELMVPQPQAEPRVFTLRSDHVGIDTYDDRVGQISSSHHWMKVGNRWVQHAAPYRYVWPSELDLMARLAGLRLRHRWAGWDKTPFTSESPSQVAVYERL